MDYNTVNILPFVYEYGTEGIALPEDILRELNEMPLFKGLTLYTVLNAGEEGKPHILSFAQNVTGAESFLLKKIYGTDTPVDPLSPIAQQILGGEYSRQFDFGQFCSLVKYNRGGDIENEDIDLHYYLVAEFDEAGTKDTVNFVIPPFAYSIADPYYAGKVSEEKTVTTTAYHGMHISFAMLGQNKVYVYESRQDTVEALLEKNLPFGTEIVGWSLTEGGESICDKYGDLGVLDGNKTFYAVIQYKDIPFQIVDHNHESRHKTFHYYDWVGLSDADVPEIISLDGAVITADTDADGTVVMICTGYTLAYGEKKRDFGHGYDAKFTVLEAGVITPVYERAYKFVIHLNGGQVAEEYADKDLDDNPDTFTYFLPEGEYTANDFAKYFAHARDTEHGIVYEVAGVAIDGNAVESITLNKSVTLDALYNATSNLFIESDYSTLTNVYTALTNAGYTPELRNGDREVVLLGENLDSILKAIMTVKTVSVDNPLFVEGSLSHEFKGMWTETTGVSGYFLDAVYEAGILCYTVVANATSEARFEDGTTLHSNYYAIDTDLNTVLFRHGWTDEFKVDAFGYSTDYHKIFYGWELPNGSILRNCPEEELKEGEINSYVPNSTETVTVTAVFINGNRIKYTLRFWSPYYFAEASQAEILLEGYYGEPVTNIPTANASGFIDMTWGVPVFAGWSVEIPEKFGYNRDANGKCQLSSTGEGYVYGETMIRATYTYKPVPVNYYINGELYETLALKHGDTLAFPTVNVPKGKVFYGWYTFAGNSLPIYPVSESETVSGLYNYHYYGFMADENATMEVQYYVPDLWLAEEERLLFIEDADFAILNDISQYELCFEPLGFTWTERQLYADENHNIYMRVTADFKEELPEPQLPMHTVENVNEHTEHIKFYLNGDLYQVVQTNDKAHFHRPTVEVLEGKVFIGWFWREYGAPFSILPEEIVRDYDINFQNNAVYGFVADADTTFTTTVFWDEYDAVQDTYDTRQQEITLTFANFHNLPAVLAQTLVGYEFSVCYYTTADGTFYAVAQAFSTP